MGSNMRTFAKNLKVSFHSGIQHCHMALGVLWVKLQQQKKCLRSDEIQVSYRLLTRDNQEYCGLRSGWQRIQNHQQVKTMTLLWPKFRYSNWHYHYSLLLQGVHNTLEEKVLQKHLCSLFFQPILIKNVMNFSLLINPNFC